MKKSATPNIADNELLYLLKKKNYKAFAIIYERYWEKLYIQAFKILKDRQDASDALQDIFTNLWNKIDHLDILNLESYLFVSVRYQSLKIINNSKRKDAFVEELKSIESQLTMNDLEEKIFVKDLSATFDLQVSLLPEKMRIIYIKAKIEGLPYREIAADLNISEHTVKTTIFRAQKLLKAKLSPLLNILLFF